MRLFQIICVLFLMLTIVTACDRTPVTIPAPEPEPKLIGKWISEGTNIAELWIDSILQIELTALTDSTYTLVQTLMNERFQFFTGHYKATDSLAVDGIVPITFFQLEPDTITYSGIYEIQDLQNADRLTLEFVRTFPDTLYLPPTVLGGFGSTDNVNLGVRNVQQYRRVE